MNMNIIIRNIQLVAVIFILVGTVLAFGFEINEMYKVGRVTLADLLLMFIYIEVIGMIGVFWASKTIRITYPVLIAITALARLIILQDKDSASINLIYQGAAILLLALSTARALALLLRAWLMMCLRQQRRLGCKSYKHASAPRRTPFLKAWWAVNNACWL